MKGLALGRIDRVVHNRSIGYADSSVREDADDVSPGAFVSSVDSQYSR